MNKTYNPKDFEEKIYKKWIDNKSFAAKVNPDKKPYTLVSPPPNITSILHIGHAFNITLQDILIRYKRMKGYEVLWVQGTDHAAIATETKICDKLKKEKGLSKFDIGREEFGKLVKEWYDSYNGLIKNQFKKLGISADWDREAFTMDDKCSRLVRKAFVNLYDKGLIYKGDRIINWCPGCKTAVSDAEIEYEEHDGHLWHIKYPIIGRPGKYICLATTRPETLFGDSAVAVNPKDDRYKDLVGEQVLLPLLDRPIPIIADDYVEMDFGTGVVKITPAHDPNDFEVGQRHNLPIIKVMNDDGTMNANAGKYEGLDKMECRKQMVEDLKELGLLEKIENYHNTVGHCYRCHEICEPIISKQWFVKMEDLVKPAIEEVEKKRTNFYPDRMSKVYFNWLYNIKDWCISRQLWSGHKIPVFTCGDCGHIFAHEDVPTSCPKCGSTNFTQETDVLDTWFSSSLWPLSVLDFIDDGEEWKYFYPCEVNVTAYDIVFFWVARMMFMCYELTGRAPFKSILMHGLVRDELGRKMSKSLGNGVDPLVLIDKYGTDAVRLSLISGVTVGGDSRYNEDKTNAASEFINKMWNAFRFLEMNLEGVEIKDISDCKLTTIDKWLLESLNKCIENINTQMDKYEFGMCANILQDFFWSTICDNYIELIKSNLNEDRQNQVSVLYYVMEKVLKLFHPFIPFVTEEIYNSLYVSDETIMWKDYPEIEENFAFDEEYKKINKLLDMVKAVRNARAEMNIPDNKRCAIYMLINKEQDLILECAKSIEKLAYGNSFTIIDTPKDDECLEINTELAKVYLPLSELIDKDKERERLSKELARLEGELARSHKMLSNEGFVAKAPKHLLDAEKEKLEKYEALYKSTKESLEKLN